MTNRLDDTITEIDSRTGRILRALDAGRSPSDVAYGMGALWISNASSSTVSRLDLSSRIVASSPSGTAPRR